MTDDGCLVTDAGFPMRMDQTKNKKMLLLERQHSFFNREVREGSQKGKYQVPLDIWLIGQYLGLRQ